MLDAREICKLVCSKSGGREDLAQGVLQEGMTPEEAIKAIEEYLNVVK